MSNSLSRRDFWRIGGAALATTGLVGRPLLGATPDSGGEGPFGLVPGAPAQARELGFEFLCEMDLELEPGQNVGAGPRGTRSIVNIIGGTIDGPKIKGTALRGGADWVVRRSDGTSELDVRATIETDDGALIYLQYRGIIYLPPSAREKMGDGQALEYSDYYFRTTPHFETGSETYAWLNRTIAVGVGEFGQNRVGYTVYAVT